MNSKWIVGGGPCLDQAHAGWTRQYTDCEVQRIELLPDENYAFDLGALDGLDPASGTMLVAFDERFGNFKRMELMQAVVDRGFKLDRFVAASAIVPEGTVLGPNAYIGEGVVMGHGCKVDFNAVVRDGARLGAGVHLRSSCWLDTGVLVGDNADIGAHSILRIGAVVGPGVKIGKHCELGWARGYHEDVPSRTIFDARYEEPVHVYGN